MKYKFGEFFSGPGGMSCGAIAAAKALGGEFEMIPTFAVDYDENACKTYHRNIHGGEGQIYRELDGGRIPGINANQNDESIVLNANILNIDSYKLQNVDGFCYGFPCNDFSTAGERKGINGSFGSLYKEGLKLIRIQRPKFFVAENVSGLLHADNYGALGQILSELKCDDLTDEGHNYIITPHLYKFEEYGVPQTRHRIIIVGIRADIARGIPEFRPPAPTTAGRPVTAREVFSELTDDMPNNDVPKLNSTVAERLTHIAPGQNIWDVNETIPEHLRLKPTGAAISSIYKVIDPDKPSYTVVGSGGGGTHMYHWDKRRTTDRERARLQSFPNDYEFIGGPQSTRKQIGMAVPPLGAQIIFEALLKTLHGIKYASVDANLVNEMDPEYVEKKRAKKAKQVAAKARKAAAEAEMPQKAIGALDAATRGHTVVVSTKSSGLQEMFDAIDISGKAA